MRSAVNTSLPWERDSHASKDYPVAEIASIEFNDLRVDADIFSSEFESLVAWVLSVDRPTEIGVDTITISGHESNLETCKALCQMWVDKFLADIDTYPRVK